VSPIAGALLDRYGWARLVMLDYLIGAATGIVIAVLSWQHSLPPWLLLAIVFVSSLTVPLSISGARSLFPVLPTRHLREPANPPESRGQVVATLLGAPFAGVLVGAFGPEWALVATGGGGVVAAGLISQVHDPVAVATGRGSVFADAANGLRYVVGNATLRGL